MPLYPSRTVLTDQFATANAATPRILNMNRDAANSALALTSGKVQYSGFTAQATVPITTLYCPIRSVAAATITLARLGLYTVAADGSITLVARGASSTTLGNATFTLASQTLDTTGGFPASYTIQYGQRYAFGCIWVATTAPTVYGGGVQATAAAWLPWIAMAQSSQSDLPTSTAIGSLSVEANIPFQAAA
jgi:hypothetical protein